MPLLELLPPWHSWLLRNLESIIDWLYHYDHTYNACLGVQRDNTTIVAPCHFILSFKYNILTVDNQSHANLTPFSRNLQDSSVHKYVGLCGARLCERADFFKNTK